MSGFRLLYLLLAIVVMWDGATTIFGTYDILDPTYELDGTQSLNLNAAIAGLVLAIVITVILLASSFIWKIAGEIAYFVRFIWIIAVGYDLYTSYLGNKYFIFRHVQENLAFNQMILLGGITFLVTASPVLVSILWSEKKSEWIAR